MIRLPDVALARGTQTALAGYQREVNANRSYPKRVTAAKELWERHSKNRPFEPVKDALASMCCGALRCVYCEDSAADEVEHVRPKALYPGEVFAWPNYVYACGPCNGPKNNQFAVFPPRAKKPLSVARKNDDPVKAPAGGSMVLVDPRAENPLDYLWLDLDTFFFTENADEGTRAWERGHYTIKTLRLNARPLLPKARESAFGSFRARLKEYAAERDAGASPEALRLRRNELLRMHHITVFAEMQRQHAGHAELKALFTAVPEALAWKPLHWEGGR